MVAMRGMFHHYDIKAKTLPVDVRRSKTRVSNKHIEQTDMRPLSSNGA